MMEGDRVTAKRHTGFAGRTISNGEILTVVGFRKGSCGETLVKLQDANGRTGFVYDGYLKAPATTAAKAPATTAAKAPATTAAKAPATTAAKAPATTAAKAPATTAKGAKKNGRNPEFRFRHGAGDFHAGLAVGKRMAGEITPETLSGVLFGLGISLDRQGFKVPAGVENVSTFRMNLSDFYVAAGKATA